MNQKTLIAGTADFSVVAVGTLPMAYQWFLGTDAILWATNSNLQLTNVQPWQAGIYTVVVTNAYGATTSAPAVLEVFRPGTVLVASEEALRAAMAVSRTVTFECDGTITLASTISNSLDTVLDATGQQVTISGSNSVRVFYVDTNVHFTMINLTVANGRCWTTGAGIFNDGGTVDLMGVAFASNNAFGGPPLGGTYSAQGGAIRNELGTLNLQSCSSTSNSAYGQPVVFGQDGDGLGGAIYNNGTMNASGCTFSNNAAIGGQGFSLDVHVNSGGNGSGGTVYNLGVAAIDDSTFSGDIASGGSGGWGLLRGWSRHLPGMEAGARFAAWASSQFGGPRF